MAPPTQEAREKANHANEPATGNCKPQPATTVGCGAPEQQQQQQQQATSTANQVKLGAAHKRQQPQAGDINKRGAQRSKPNESEKEEEEERSNEKEEGVWAIPVVRKSRQAAASTAASGKKSIPDSIQAPPSSQAKSSISSAATSMAARQSTKSSSGASLLATKLIRSAAAAQETAGTVAIDMSEPNTMQRCDKDERANGQLAKRPGSQQKKIFLNPSDSFCYWWSAIVSLAFLYNFWSLSYRFAFREIDSSTWHIWFAFDYAADAIYLLDIFVNFRTGYLEDGVLQRDVSKIATHYRDESTLFYLDSCCLLPFDILYLSFGFCSIFRCNRLVKIHKFWSFVDRTERHTNYPNVVRTFTLVHYILVIFHWNACLFHMISKHKIIDIESLFKINNNQCDDIWCQYLHAFYWSTLALTIIGDLPNPRARGEYIYVIVELFFGLFLFASVLGHVANIVTNVSAARKEFQARLDAVKTFMRTRRVSDDLQRKVIRWFDYLWISQKSSDEERTVACLPDRLKAEIAIHVNLDTLKRVDIFQATEAGFLRELVLRLKPVLFSPGDYVCRKDEAGHEMYIVSRGILEVVTNEGQTVVATFRAGSYFGEIAVLNVGSAGNKRTASVRSVGYSDLFCLSKQDLWDVLKDYPNAEARIRAVAEERLSALGDSGGARKLAAAAVGSSSSSKSRRRDGSVKHRQGRASAASAVQDEREESSRENSYDESAFDEDDATPTQLSRGRGDVRSPSSSHHNHQHHRAHVPNQRASSFRQPQTRGGGRPKFSYTMEPICDHGSRSSSTRRQHQTISANNAGGHLVCPTCNYHYQQQARSQLAAGGQACWQLAPVSHLHQVAPTTRNSTLASTTQRSSMSSTSVLGTNNSHHFAPLNSLSSSGSQAVVPSSAQRNQLSIYWPQQQQQQCQRAPAPIGQSRSFECTPVAGPLRSPTTTLLDFEPGRSRSGAAIAAAQPLTSSDTFSLSHSTPEKASSSSTSNSDTTNQTHETILEQRQQQLVAAASYQRSQQQQQRKKKKAGGSVDGATGFGPADGVGVPFLRLPSPALVMRRSSSLMRPECEFDFDFECGEMNEDGDEDDEGDEYSASFHRATWDQQHQQPAPRPRSHGTRQNRCAHPMQAGNELTDVNNGGGQRAAKQRQVHKKTCRRRGRPEMASTAQVVAQPPPAGSGQQPLPSECFSNPVQEETRELREAENEIRVQTQSPAAASAADVEPKQHDQDTRES